MKRSSHKRSTVSRRIKIAKHDFVEGDKITADTVVQHKHYHSKSGEGSTLKKSTFDADYSDLIQQLKVEARENCQIDNAVCNDHVVDIVPLQITNDVQRNKYGFHFHHREERAELLSEPPVGDVEIEELFVKAQELAEYESTKKTFDQLEAKTKFIQTNSNTVGVIGQAGCGKSTLAKTILARVVGEKRLYKVDSIFYFQFRNVNYNDKGSLLKFLSPSLTAEWMTDSHRRNAVLSELKSSNNVIVIMDGLDETKIDFTKHHQKISINDIATAEDFLKNMLDGTILSNAKKIIFSRPRQMVELPDKYRPHFLVNILGLDDDSQMHICQDICGENSDRVYKYIRKHPDISSFCYIPINCILSCFAFDEIMSQGLSNIPQSMTGILTYVLALFVDSDNLRGEFQAKNVAELAWQGFKNEKFTFKKKDLAISKLTDNDIDNLFVVVAKERKLRLFGGNPQITSYFSHLILQEFLVAVHLLLFTSLNDFKKSFFPDSRNPEYDLTSSRFEMVTKFIFGLCNPATFDKLNDYIPLCSFPKEKLDLMQKLVKDTTYDTLDDNVLLYFGWAYELQNHCFTNKLASCLTDRVRMTCKMLPSDYAAFYYVCSKKEKPITLDELEDQNFYGKCWQFVSDPQFSSSIQKVEHLRVCRNKIGDTGANLLSKWIDHVDWLDVSNCDITSVGIESIANALIISNHQIDELDISHNNIEDRGAVALSKCIHRVHKLNSDKCGFTEAGFRSIVDALMKSEHQIRFLNINSNKIRDEGAIALSKCIHKIDQLWAKRCSITNVGIEAATNILLESNHHLSCLDISDNDIEDEGAIALSKCIHEIDELFVKRCNITHVGIESISEALANSNNQISELKINFNKIGDEGAHSLSTCIHKINQLYAKNCDVTNVGIASIAEALEKSNYQMERLEMTIKDASPDELQTLQDRLRDKVQELEISHEEEDDEGSLEDDEEEFEELMMNLLGLNLKT